MKPGGVLLQCYAKEGEGDKRQAKKRGVKTLKWFFALNEEGNQFENYSAMLKVAVHTALRNTSLEPFFLYDGKENELTVWLKNRNISIIPCRSFIYNELSEIARKKQNNIYLSIGTGAFLRVEIPQVTRQLGIEDKFILYTDLDVMFLDEVSGYLSKLEPKYFAVAPEFNMNDYFNMNTGVMLMNLKNLRKKDDDFKRFIKANLETLVNAGWDQGAYRIYYNRKRYRKLLGPRWNKLPSEYNWKPYWTKNSNPKIVHFHGPKPTQRNLLFSENPPANLKPILYLTKGKYIEWCKLWDDMFDETI